LLGHARIGIPSAHRPALRRLAELSDEDFTQMMHHLKDQSQDFLSKGELMARLGKGAPPIAADASDIVDALIGLQTTRGSHGWSLEALQDAVTLGAPSDFGDLAAVAARRLTTLLSAPPIMLVAKAFDLLGANQHLYHVSRITTDIRPVFSDDAEPVAHGGIILHQLSLEYWTDGDARTLQIALDGEDLAALRATLDKAARKESHLRAVVGLAGLRLIDTTVQEGSRG
jgi:hypothetical protein